jgi:hypothetical protein
VASFKTTRDTTVTSTGDSQLTYLAYNRLTYKYLTIYCAQTNNIITVCCTSKFCATCVVSAGWYAADIKMANFTDVEKAKCVLQFEQNHSRSIQISSSNLCLNPSKRSLSFGHSHQNLVQFSSHACHIILLDLICLIFGDEYKL